MSFSSASRLPYVVYGAATSVAASTGLLLLRLATGAASSIAGELSSQGLTYAYVTVASALIVTGFAYAVGRRTEVLQTLATTDSLTGLLNRRATEDQLRLEFERARRYRVPLSLLLIDLDGLKRINDLEGHAAGDRVLRSVSAAIRHTLRASDHGGRWGGDEFVILAPHTTRQAARRFGERVALRISKRARSRRTTVTASVGIATLEPDKPQHATARALIEEADRALYTAKERARGRVIAS
jgi:two-component system cell cycle response regulator